jgi:Cell Wall Hydrolase
MNPQPYEQLTPANLIALCIWRESRDQTTAAKYGVACVIKNRYEQEPKYGEDYLGVITRKNQFSSFNENDPNAKLWPKDDDPAWLADTADGRAWVTSYGCALNILEDESIDITDGAVYYFSPPVVAPPVNEWGNVAHTTTLDKLQFYKVA